MEASEKPARQIGGDFDDAYEQSARRPFGAKRVLVKACVIKAELVLAYCCKGTRGLVELTPGDVQKRKALAAMTLAQVQAGKHGQRDSTRHPVFLAEANSCGKANR